METGASVAAEISLELVAEGFTQPVYLTHAADKRLFVVEQPGRIVQFVPGGTGTRVFLDIRNRVRLARNEQGLLSVAFHPQFVCNGRLFVNYTKAGGTTVVAEFAADAARATAQPSSERVILEVKQPYGNHNGGQLQFGPDGFLYIGMGDGGAGGDPRGAGQNQRTLLGAMLRIDIDGKHPYAIPGSNPYARGGGLDEIWAIGLRNPWRFSSDRKNGDLYIADVGQNEFEVVNWQKAWCDVD